ncbi:MAG: hypothetical protein GXO79_02620 [Chlorobi bacterium]|nr:hypothetical protein [Chlorobiota bacterium]
MKINIPIVIEEIESDGCHLLVEAAFAEPKKGWLIIDTGANKSVFAKNIFEKNVELLDETEEDISAGINASIENSIKVIIPVFKLGELVLTNFETILIDLNYLNSVYSKISDKKIIGLIGGDFLKNYDAVIHYKNKLLILNK